MPAVPAGLAGARGARVTVHLDRKTLKPTRRKRDGWALQLRGSDEPFLDTYRRTRQQCRDLRRDKYPMGWDIEIVPVRIKLETLKP